MIDKDEIEAKADEFRINPANVERDYLFGWLLAGIYSQSALSRDLILKGGNCLRKGYFEHARFSGDLDFSIQTQLDTASFATELNKVCNFVSESTGITFLIDRNRVEKEFAIDGEKTVYQASLYFKDFYGNPDRFVIKAKLDITDFDKVYLPIQERFLIHPYSDLGQTRVAIRCTKLEEVLASKLKCLLQRGACQDLYDFVFSFLLNQEIEVDRKEVVLTFLKKTIFEPSPGVARTILLELPLSALRQAWERYVVCPTRSLIQFDDALSHFESLVSVLFEGMPSYAFNVSYFPSSLRHPIIAAGKESRLLRFSYDGITREIEPYALTFKRRKSDGFGQEYFYGYDRSGGRSSGPGIKSFVHDKIRDLTVLEESFEPRYPIELSKAGEFGNKTYFGSPFPHRASVVRLPRARRRVGGSIGISYIIQCSVCGKKFTRSRMDMKLNKHKDRFGNRCFGHFGVFVGQR